MAVTLLVINIVFFVVMTTLTLTRVRVLNDRVQKALHLICGCFYLVAAVLLVKLWTMLGYPI